MVPIISESVRDEARYAIGEAAKIIGVHRNTLRAYLRAGLLRFSFSPRTGRKYISGKELRKFWTKEVN